MSDVKRAITVSELRRQLSYYDPTLKVLAEWEGKRKLINPDANGGFNIVDGSHCLIIDVECT